MTDGEPDARAKGMARLLRPTIIITLLTLAGQGVGFITQVVTAAIFGTGTEMDAFLAANTLPQYVIAVLLSALTFVFTPVFVEYAAAGRDDDAWQVASSILTLSGLALGALAILGMVFVEPLLRLTTPGLSPESLTRAAQVALITWPTILLTGISSLLAGIYQAHERFSWPSVAPVLGALLNLALVALLARPLGVIGLAIAATSSLALQAILLLPIALRPGTYRLALDWRHPGVQQMIRMLIPLVLSGLLIRWTPVIERFLASGLPQGSISQLGYAFKLLSLGAMLVSTGITTVVFPQMASNIAVGDMSGLRQTLSLGMRVMWLVIAPAITVGAALALPLITALFQRGAFTSTDAVAVAGLLQIYLVALVSMGLGNVVSRAFYALKDTRTPAILGVFEALAYAIYTPLLAWRFGAAGVAWGFVIYFDLSLLLLTAVIRHKTGNVGGRRVLGSFARTGAAATLGGATAWAITLVLGNPWLQLIAGGLAALLVYGAALLVLGSPEARLLAQMISARLRPTPAPLANPASK